MRFGPRRGTDKTARAGIEIGPMPLRRCYWGARKSAGEIWSALEPGAGGSGEIRTHGWVTPSAVFKTAALNHSATLPSYCAARCEQGRHCNGTWRNLAPGTVSFRRRPRTIPANR